MKSRTGTSDVVKREALEGEKADAAKRQLSRTGVKKSQAKRQVAAVAAVPSL